jgi:hypothetical protein
MDALYDHFGPGMEKSAEETFMDRLTREHQDVDIFGPKFVKVAEMQGEDPWSLAYQVGVYLDGLEKAAAQGMPLAQFYVSWADDLVKESMSRILMGRAVSRSAGKSGGGLLSKLNPANWGSRGQMNKAVASSTPKPSGAAAKTTSAPAKTTSAPASGGAPTAEQKFMQDMSKQWQASAAAKKPINWKNVGHGVLGTGIVGGTGYLGYKGYQAAKGQPQQGYGRGY